MTRTLTDADIEALKEAIKGHSVCQMGLTPYEVGTLKRFLKTFNTASAIVGKLILSAIVVAGIAIWTKGFWLTLLTGVKAAGGVGK